MAGHRDIDHSIDEEQKSNLERDLHILLSDYLLLTVDEQSNMIEDIISIMYKQI